MPLKVSFKCSLQEPREASGTILVLRIFRLRLVPVFTHLRSNLLCKSSPQSAGQVYNLILANPRFSIRVLFLCVSLFARPLSCFFTFLRCPLWLHFDISSCLEVLTRCKYPKKQPSKPQDQHPLRPIFPSQVLISSV